MVNKNILRALNLFFWPVIRRILGIISPIKNYFRKIFLSYKYEQLGREFSLGRRFILSGKRIRIGENFSCLWDCRIVADEVPLEIGGNVVFSHHVDVLAGPYGYIKIGSRTSIGQFSVLRNCSHEYKDPDRFIQDQGHIPGTIDIGDDCIISASCVILPNTKVGNGCVIGAGSVLSGDFPDYAIIMGNPARVIRKRK